MSADVEATALPLTEPEPTDEQLAAAAAELARTDRKRRRRRMLAALLMVLVLLFALLVGWYMVKREPLPVPGLGKQPLPHYSFSIYGTSRPMGVAVSPDGERVYVTSSDGARTVALYDTKGDRKGELRPPPSTGSAHVPVYVAVDPTNGQVWVSDRASAAVYIYTSGGKYLRTFEPKGLRGISHAGWQPLGLAFDQDGRLYATEVSGVKHQILVLRRDGSLVRAFGAEDGLKFPNGIAVGPGGNIYVTDSNNGRLLIYSPSGTKLAAVNRGVAEGDLGLPRGLAFDKPDGGGHLYAVDTSSHTIKSYRPADDPAKPAPNYVGTFGGEGQLDGAFEYPNGIAADGRNHVYITDRENNRVQVWTY
jgi:DNA-binding beta-propeller fold protein YncE